MSLLVGICHTCGDKVTGAGAACQAMGNLYHTNCFICCSCSRALRGKAFYNVHGKVYCEEDYMVSLGVELHMLLCRFTYFFFPLFAVFGLPANSRKVCNLQSLNNGDGKQQIVCFFICSLMAHFGRFLHFNQQPHPHHIIPSIQRKSFCFCFFFSVSSFCRFYKLWVNHIIQDVSAVVCAMNVWMVYHSLWTLTIKSIV